MIFDWLFTAISGFVTSILNGLPSLPSDVSGAIYANDYLTGVGVPASISGFIPWTAFMGFFTFLAAWFVFCQGYRMTMFILDKLHITGGGGE